MLELHALTLADERFALPLAVFGRSVLDHLREGALLRLTVIDGGLTPATRRRLLDSWDNRITVAWHEPGLGDLASLSGQRIPPLTLARLRHLPLWHRPSHERARPRQPGASAGQPLCCGRVLLPL